MLESPIILGVVFIVIVVIALFLNYIGFFSKIIIQEKEMGSYLLVFEEHRGDYKGTAKVQDEIYYSLLNEYGIKTYKGFGVYYDDPKKVAKEELRSIAGCILEGEDYDKIEVLKENNFKIKEVARQNSFVVEFPYKNSLSVVIGIMKVYPAINKYIEKNKIVQNEIMEIYDVPNKKIIYVMKK